MSHPFIFFFINLNSFAVIMGCLLELIGVDQDLVISTDLIFFDSDRVKDLVLQELPSCGSEVWINLKHLHHNRHQLWIHVWQDLRNTLLLCWDSVYFLKEVLSFESRHKGCVLFTDAVETVKNFTDLVIITDGIATFLLWRDWVWWFSSEDNPFTEIYFFIFCDSIRTVKELK